MQANGNYILHDDKVVQYAFGRFQNIIDVRRLVQCEHLVEKLKYMKY